MALDWQDGAKVADYLEENELEVGVLRRDFGYSTQLASGGVPGLSNESAPMH